MKAALALLGVVLFAILLHVPALRMGFYADDYIHQLALEGKLPMRATALYDFGEIDDWLDAREDLEVGTFPWWVSADWKARFFRPVSSSSLALDHALYGRWAMGYQLSSFALFALLLVLLRHLYRALGLSEGVGLFAVALFGVSTATVIPVVWPANRNTLVAVLFAVLAALVALRDPTTRGRLIAIACALLAVLSKESGIVTFALLALIFHRQKAGSLWLGVPVTLAALHVAFLTTMGYGTRSLFYATPWHQTERFFFHLGVLVPTGLLGFATPFPLDAIAQRMDKAWIFAVVALFLAVPIGVYVLRRVRGAENTGFLALWTILALLPQAGVLPSDRLLFFPMVGGAALLALAIARGSRAPSLMTRAGAWTLLVTAGVLSALATTALSNMMATIGTEVRRVALAADVGSPDLGYRQVFLMQSPSMFVGFTIGSAWGVEKEDHDLAFHPLQIGRRGFVWEREDERTFTMSTLGPEFLTLPFERVYMTSEEPVELGASFDGGIFQVHAMAVSSTGPLLLRFTFDEPIDDERYRFLIWSDGRLTHTAPPAIGESRTVPAAAPLSPTIP